MRTIRFSFSTPGAVALGVCLLLMTSGVLTFVITSAIESAFDPEGAKLPIVEPQKTVRDTTSYSLASLQGLDIFKPVPSAEPMIVPEEVNIPDTKLQFDLKGVFMGDQNASAIILVEKGKSQMFFVGDEVSTGVTLHAVLVDAIVLNHQGKHEKLSLANRVGTIVPPDAPNHQQLVAVPATRPTSAVNQQEGFQNTIAAQRAILDAIQSRPDGPGKQKH